MSSPFPGMDPYVEASLGTTFHHELSSEIARQLAPILRPKYVARTVATTISVPMCVPPSVPQSIPHVSVEIRNVEGGKVVTHIEVLSPANKFGQGRKDYIDKRGRLLFGNCNLVEIDLLCTGIRILPQQQFPEVRYFVMVSQGNRCDTHVWAIRLEDRLPVILIPLMPGDPDVPLDLGLAFRSIYDGLAFDLGMDYSKPPELPLRSDEFDWIEKHLRDVGIRS